MLGAQGGSGVGGGVAGIGVGGNVGGSVVGGEVTGLGVGGSERAVVGVSVGGGVKVGVAVGLMLDPIAPIAIAIITIRAMATVIFLFRQRSLRNCIRMLLV